MIQINNTKVYERVLSLIRKYYPILDLNEAFDRFGFFTKNNEMTEDFSDTYIEYLISEILNTESIKHWTDSCQSIKCLIRDYGIPNSLRPQIWLIFIKSKISANIDVF